MSRKKKRKSPPTGSTPLRSLLPAANSTSGEARNSVAVTVAWMLSTLCTAIASVLALATFSIVRWGGEAADENAPLGFVPGLMLLIAVLTGLASLGLIPVVYRVRPAAPPRSITIAAVLIGLLPLVILLVLLLR